MKISEARTHALQLLAAADAAEAAGQDTIAGASLIEALQQVDNAARDELAKAIEESKAKTSSDVAE